VPFVAPVSVNDAELDSPIDVYGPALAVAREIEYPVAPVLADHARATWLFPGVAVTPLGVDGVIGAEGEELPPLHAANASVESPSSGAVTPACVSGAIISSRCMGSMPTAVGSLIAMRFAFIQSAIPGTNLIAIPYWEHNAAPTLTLTAERNTR